MFKQETSVPLMGSTTCWSDPVKKTGKSFATLDSLVPLVGVFYHNEFFTIFFSKLPSPSSVVNRKWVITSLTGDEADRAAAQSVQE